MFFTDASVQAGQSGGPIFTETGQLVGVCVSNSKDIMSGRIYPNINMCIPICEVYGTLSEYGLTKGKIEIITNIVKVNFYFVQMPKY